MIQAKNFDYLKGNSDFADLYAYCNEAEINQIIDPEKSAINSRRALEYIVRAIYLFKGMEIPERSSLFQLVNAESFKNFIQSDDLLKRLHYIRKAGNNSAHLGKVAKKESFFSLLNLYVFVGSVLVKLKVIDDYPTFDRNLIPGQAEVHLAPKENMEPTNALVEKYEGQLETALVTKAVTGISEAETRKYFIDQMLREAGWDILEAKGSIMPAKACIEIQLAGMPNHKETGFADYVLFGANGKPLAVIEAKRTSVDAARGKHQAELYAKCLEAQYGVMPVIYYTNGFNTFVIDGLGYPSRPVYGYHTQADLELIIQKRERAEITDLRIRDEITDREYQKRGIKAVCEYFNKKHRRALLVMATGTGKTRVAISLVELLMRNNWVKNVLFLADRTALVKQAYKNFTKLLPGTYCVLSDDNKPDLAARVMFSTYQTMINYIDRDTKDFSVGRFDLIIVDEAHRSIFGKYGDIFDYFDSLLVGLTATPRSEVDRSTYQLFEQEQGEPNFAYELEEAVAEKYLVPYKGIIRHSAHINNGIKYENLSKEEKEQLEKVWEYEKAQRNIDPDEDYHRDIEKDEIFKFLFNEDTVDKVLQDLMENGLRVQSGERIGKTIIFAYNHKHAVLIVERFGKLYPEYGPSFCQLIDNSVTYAGNLIDQFEVRDNLPQIAVSVDMLDTGVDVPDILNLVFFKVIKSKIKFMQMIGRGTRLSENIFGPGKNKECFYIFDYCNNFEFFNDNPQGVEAKPVQSLTERLFCLRTDISVFLQHSRYQEDPFAKNLHDELKTLLHSQVATLNDSRIGVRKHWDLVCKYRKSENWIFISETDALHIKNSLSPLLIQKMENEESKQFDLLILYIELSLLDADINAVRSKKKVIEIARDLQKATSIPLVMAKIETIKEVLSSHFWENLNLDGLERVRKDLRELILFLKGNSKNTFTIDIEDAFTDGGEAPGIVTTTTYKQRVVDYLAENKDNAVLQKIFNVEPLSQADIRDLERILWQQLGTREEYSKYAQNMIYGGNVAAFIRSIIGVNRNIAIRKFTELISESNLNSMQEEYLKTILNYVCENGDITTSTFGNDPFVNFDWYDAFGDKLSDLTQYVENLHKVITA
ncbi:DUF4145 domain-containing protein [Parabacteroides sp. AF18-52]|jgi:hypothetical protein|uniref:DEAD/DEAH box helicase family protein n=1 Tax=Parabacteroides TaxID=375288 RepID=UPI000EFE3F8E|nr:DEAD/DEAH box helicase family protein [Parabacteroides sp. AF18-52]RHR37524.1 DUF4145 domain-containing protein [Parabacteroides sp. AF18-52]